MKLPASTSEPATAVTTLTSLVLEPSWLSQVFEGQSNSSNKWIFQLVASAQGKDAMYSIWSVHGIDSFYKHPKPNIDQLVIPKSRIFCFFLYQEPHSSALAGYMGVHKTILALWAQVYWLYLIDSIK